jgi:hypothetical protein
MAVAKVSLHQELFRRRISLEKKALVIGGGVAGIQAALDIANAGHQVILVEKEPIARVYVNGHVRNPGAYELPERGGVLEAILEDETGQCFAYELCELRARPSSTHEVRLWQAAEAPLWQATRYWGGANDGQFHYPVEFRGLRMRPAGAGPGELLVSNLMVTTLVPALAHGQ